MKRCYLISVGTSIIGHVNDQSDSESIDIQFLMDMDRVPHEDAVNQNAYYRSSWEVITDFIDDLYSREEVAQSCAELSSILAGKDSRLRSDDSVVLIATATMEGIFSAKAIARVIREKWGLIGTGEFSSEMIRLKTDIAGLGRADDASFASVGLPNFIRFLQETIHQYRDSGYQVVLIPTGGYKALIPYMVIAGILENIPNRYTYEQSGISLELPALPLHVDVPEWLRVETVLDVLHGRKDGQHTLVYTRFRDKLSGLMVTDEQEGCLVRTGLDEIFRKRAREISAKPELVIRASHSPLMAFLSEPHQKRFLQLCAIGHLIWKGDRVPEMVDHGLKHHNDLFLLAERFLLPVFYFKPDFLASHELFVLLCALFLHDCGHVVGYLDTPSGPRRLFPTEIRDYHHILGYLRLMEPESHGGTGKILLDALCGENETHADLKQNFLSAVATIGLFHRKKKTIETDPKPSELDQVLFPKNADFMESLKTFIRRQSPHVLAVTDSDSALELVPLTYDRARLLVCLLRVIDGLDEQASRTGDLSEVAFHLAQLETEAKEQNDRAHILETAISSISGNNGTADFERFRTLLDQRIISYAGKESKGLVKEVVDAANRRLEEKGIPSEQRALDASRFRSEVEGVTSDIKPLVEEYMNARLLAFFKEFQKGPFFEKIYIRGVEIQGDMASDGKVELTVRFQIPEDPEELKTLADFTQSPVIRMDDHTFDMTSVSGVADFARYMKEKTRGELQAENGLVGQILEDAGIRMI